MRKLLTDKILLDQPTTSANESPIQPLNQQSESKKGRLHTTQIFFIFNERDPSVKNKAFLQFINLIRIYYLTKLS